MSSKTAGSEASEREGSESGADERSFEYFGWVYHVGVNSIGHEYCHLRYLLLKGNKVEMYKRDPQDNPGIKPIRSGVVGHTLMVEEQGRRKVNNGDLYVLRFYNRLDEKKKGERYWLIPRCSKWDSCLDSRYPAFDWRISMTVTS